MNLTSEAVAQKLVEKFAPDEIPMFQILWRSRQSTGLHDEGVLKGGPGHLTDDGASTILLTAVLIPIAVEFGKHLAAGIGDALADRVRQWLRANRHTESGMLSDKRIEEIIQYARSLFDRDVC